MFFRYRWGQYAAVYPVAARFYVSDCVNMPASMGTFEVAP